MKKEATKKGAKVAKKITKIIVRDIVCLVVGLAVIAVRLLKYIIKSAGRFIAGLFGILYIMIPDIASKVSKRVPRLLKISAIYILLIGTTIGVYASYNVVQARTINEENKAMIEVKENKIVALIKKNTKLAEENKSYAELKKELEQTKNELQKLKTINNLNNIEKDIYNKSIATGLKHEQAILVIAISKHETGRWTSKAFKNMNNFGGIMCSTGLKSYNSYNEGLDAFVKLLKNYYFNKGLNTIEKIGAIYCPIGASNDPAGVNKHWIPNVTKYYNNYLNI